MHFLPVALPFFLAFLLFFVFLVVLIEIGILGYAYEKIGLSRRHAFLILLLSLIGSYINIPVFRLPAEEMVTGGAVYYYGMQYVVPIVREWPGTLVAVNLGGAVIPFLLSVYLVIKNRLFVAGFFGVLAVTVVVHLLASPVRGVGIAVPTIIPPVVSAIAAVLLSRRAPAALAYVSGSLGTLIGADLLNLGRIQGLGAPVASIGGAGTYDGIFLTGILAVLLAGLMSRKPAKRSGVDSPSSIRQ